MTMPMRKSSIAAALLLIYFILPAAGNENGEQVKRIKSGDFIKTVVLTGSLQAEKAENFVVPVLKSWEVQLKWIVEEGEYVKPGDPVVRFDTANLASEIENLEMDLKVKEEQKQQKKSDFQLQEYELNVKVKQAQIDYKKKELDASVPRELMSASDYDTNQLNLKKSGISLENAERERQVRLAEMKAEIEKIDIEMEETRNKLEDKKTTLNRMTLYAKTEGAVVYEDHPWQGRKIQIGDSVFSAMHIATIPDRESLQVEAWLSETDINLVKPGQPVEITLDAYPVAEHTFSGTVKDIINNAEKRNRWGDGHYFRVSIEMNTRDTEIMKPGMSVRCVVRTAHIPAALLVPLEMIGYDGSRSWIKPRGKQALPVEALGVNEFYIALDNARYPELKDGLILKPVLPGDMKENNHEEN